MTEPSLQQLERDVEAARAQLARNLRTLRSPAAHAEFTEAIKHDAFAAKDELIARGRSAAQDRINDWIDTLKARAAENPAAVLAIAAGIGWRMMRKPPIATTLVGVGLFSLLRGNAPPRTGRSDEEYVDRAKGRLREQSSELAAGIGEQASAVAAAATRKMGQWSEQAQAALREGGAQAAETMEHWSEEARAALRNGSAQAVDSSVAAAAAASGRFDAAWQKTADLAAQSARGLDRTASDLQGRANGSDLANQILLGAAGAAVAAAFGVALQRRITATEPAD
jgi:hypothetical protein